MEKKYYISDDLGKHLGDDKEFKLQNIKLE